MNYYIDNIIAFAKTGRSISEEDLKILEQYCKIEDADFPTDEERKRTAERFRPGGMPRMWRLVKLVFGKEK